MTDFLPGSALHPDDAPLIRVVAQFVRDLSFENPRAPESLQGGAKPNLELNVELAARGRTDGLFELDLKLTVASTNEGETQFQIELLYGGLFEVRNVPQDQLELAILVECPRFMFPFARRIIADLTIDGGFPPLLLDPIDFLAVYMAQRQNQGVDGPAFNT